MAGAAKDSKAYASILKAFNDRSIDLVAWITKKTAAVPADKQAAVQLMIRDTMQNIARERGFSDTSYPTLGTTILTQQSYKIKNFGAKAFLMTEKQLAVVVSDLEIFRKEFVLE